MASFPSHSREIAAVRSVARCKTRDHPGNAHRLRSQGSGDCASAALPKVAYSRFTSGKSLAGKRIGVLRDLMIEASLADRDSIRVANEAIADMKKAGAVIVDPVNVHKVIADLVPYLEPGLLPKNFPSAFPKSPEPIDHIVSMAFDHNLVPSGARGAICECSPRSRAVTRVGTPINRYFRERGDAKFKSVRTCSRCRCFPVASIT